MLKEHLRASKQKIKKSKPSLSSSKKKKSVMNEERWIERREDNSSQAEFEIFKCYSIFDVIFCDVIIVDMYSYG